MVIFTLHPLDVIYNGHTTSDAYYARSDEQREAVLSFCHGEKDDGFPLEFGIHVPDLS